MTQIKLFIFFLTFSFLLVFFLTSGNLVYSQNSVNQPPKIPGLPKNVPGVTCGDATNRTINQCCVGQEIKDPVDNLFPDDFGCVFSLCISKVLRSLASGLVSLTGVRKDIDSFQGDLDTNPCVSGNPSAKASDPSCVCIEDKSSSKILCDKFLSNRPEYGKCVECAEKKQGVWTAIGCVDTDASKFVSNTVLGTAVGFAGVAAFLCIIYSAFLMQTSAGNPERLKKAREYLTNCIIGLILIIFSVFILRLIGVDILKIPGFQ